MKDIKLYITNPDGYNLNSDLTFGIKLIPNQKEAFKNADFIYGKRIFKDLSWTITKEKMQLTNKAKFLHCLPVRRNLVVEDSVLDDKKSNFCYTNSVFRNFIKYMINVVKLGGDIIFNKKLLISSLKNFSKLDGYKIIVHGGGKIADLVSNKMGYNIKIINGRRITDKTTLEIVVMTYSGLINKKIVSKLQSLGLNPIGFSGADGNLVKSYKRSIKKIDYGNVGNLTINSINTDLIKSLFRIGIIPVLSPITHDGNGNLLNTNADTIASYLSISLSKTYKVILSYCFNKLGVLKNLKDENSSYYKIEETFFQKLKNKKIINKGMIPKLENAFYALKNGVSKVTISHPNYLNHPTKKTILCLG